MVQLQQSGVVVRRRPTISRSVWLLIAIFAALLVAFTSVRLGARAVDWADVWAALNGAQETFAQAAITKRIPRTFTALLVGAALGVAGAVMQGVTRNPLADPGILGVNTGAALAVAIGVAGFGLVTYTQYIWTAIVGGGITAVAVYLIGSLGRGGPTPLKLTLAGAATSAALASFISAVILGRNDIAGLLRSWQVGGVGGANYSAISHFLPFFVVGMLLCILSSRSLNSLALGDELAAGLGERVMRARLLASFGAVMLCGGATAIVGPIAFVGLVVPHLFRLLIGVDYRWLIVFSAIGGALLLTLADVVGRIVAAPQEIPVGIIVALVGAPIFIYIVRRQKVREL